jgi:hypothetical protein
MFELPSAPNTLRYASDHGAEVAQHSYVSLRLVLKQPLEELPRNDSNQVRETTDQETTAARIPERFASVIRDKTERAAMARPSKQSAQVIKDKPVMRHALKAVELEAINLGFTLNFATDSITSGHKLLIEGTNKIVISNQVKFDENLYPHRSRNMVEQNLSDVAELDIITISKPKYYYYSRFNIFINIISYYFNIFSFYFIFYSFWTIISYYFLFF